MRKTKIICTLGPATDRDGILEQCIESGMNVARLNFSHGSHEEQQKRIDKLYELRKKYQKPIAALLDTKGPEIRLGDFKDGKVNLKQGQKLSLIHILLKLRQWIWRTETIFFVILFQKWKINMILSLLTARHL